MWSGLGGKNFFGFVSGQASFSSLSGFFRTGEYLSDFGPVRDVNMFPSGRFENSRPVQASTVQSQIQGSFSAANLYQPGIEPETVRFRIQFLNH